VAFKLAVAGAPSDPSLLTGAEPKCVVPEENETEPVGGNPRLPVPIIAVSIAPCGAPALCTPVLVDAFDMEKLTEGEELALKLGSPL
jgi:hypothetical protein